MPERSWRDRLTSCWTPSGRTRGRSRTRLTTSTQARQIKIRTAPAPWTKPKSIKYKIWERQEVDDDISTHLFKRIWRDLNCKCGEKLFDGWQSFLNGWGGGGRCIGYGPWRLPNHKWHFVQPLVSGPKYYTFMLCLPAGWALNKLSSFFCHPNFHSLLYKSWRNFLAYFFPADFCLLGNQRMWR